MPTRTPTAEVALAATRLHVVLGRVVRRLRQLQQPGEVRPTEMSALSRLDRTGPLPASLLAEHERVSPQAISETVTLLERAGLVTRATDANDGRRSVLTVTAPGRRLLASRRTRSTLNLARALDEALTPEEQLQVLAVIPLLERLADRL